MTRVPSFKSEFFTSVEDAVEFLFDEQILFRRKNCDKRFRRRTP